MPDGRPAVVTGGAGFLGGYVVERLRRRGVTDVMVVRSKDFDLVHGDDVRRLLREVRPSLVVHLAGRVGGIGVTSANPATFFYDNIMMGVQLMHECHAAGVAKLVAVSSICAYPAESALPLRAESLWQGYPEESNAPYGIAKRVLDVQAAAYRAQYGFNAVVVYPTNLYGPRDDFDLATSHAIPAMLRKFHGAMLRGEPEVVLWGDGTPTRDFLYVQDCAEAIALAAERYDASTPLNLGSGQEVGMRDLAAKVAHLVGYEGRVSWDSSMPRGQRRRLVDVIPAKQQLGFVATTTLDEGLARTYAWMKDNVPLPGG
jgi:GDP-L-fucose synthase